MKKASLGITAAGAVLLVLIIVISINITFFEGVSADPGCVDIDGDGYGVCPDCNIINGCLFDGDDCNDTETTTHPSASELYDSEDNDCDGYIDEYSNPNGDPKYLQDTCYGIGECGTGMVWYFTPDDIIDCSTNPERPEYDGSTDICDGKDNDCDGDYDEDFDYKGIHIDDSCDGVGVCGTGVVYCVDNALSDCSTNPGRPEYDGSTEICDLEDNDCDGETDEDFFYLGDPIGANCYGTGECGFGFVQCNGTGAAMCSTDPGGFDDESVPEICDYKDNDCDGETDEDGVCEYNISLNIGWNLFSPTMGPVESDTDKHIPLRKGWNLIGYASSKPLYWLNATIENGMDRKNISDAAKEGWVQRICYYYDDGSYRDIPGDEDYLKESRGYWVYALVDDLTLILPSVGGSLDTNSVTWMDVNATNGSSTITVEQASQLGWFHATLYYFDADEQLYKLVPFNERKIYSWKGYWLSGNLENFSLIFN